MRLLPTIGGLLSLLLALDFGNKALIAALPNPPLINYYFAVTMAFTGTVILVAGLTAYQGGWRFWLGNTLLNGAFLLFGYAVLFQPPRQFDGLYGCLLIGLVLSVGGVGLVWAGHKRYLHKRSAAVTEPAASPTESNTNPLILSAPMPTWRLFVLGLASLTTYLAAWVYQTHKDLAIMAGKPGASKFIAFLTLIPPFSFIIFFHTAEHVAAQARQANVALRLEAGVLTALLLPCQITGWYLPLFLAPLSLSVSLLPWLLLHRQMNRLREAYQPLPPMRRYTWPQRGILLVATPLLVSAILQTPHYFANFRGIPVYAKQRVHNDPRYQLRIPDDQWRQVASGTLFPDTNLELMAQDPQHWVVVRIVEQNKSLDSYVDQRRRLLLSVNPQLKIEESRTLESGADLTPIALARYGTEDRGASGFVCYTATIATADYVVEAIGQSPKPDSSVQALVNSLRLTEDKP
ncbi:hypothetical protein KFZ76_20695 [Methylovulum psychrotolerans]|uniref:hypothetical protein n=1 Tax=Methylovulum psychrotolerans TaxID=1704499 RepID=UPI001BFFA891|nr:hypothetical protein [Methylovulum psychrotolerans]MBT9100126.1 hypothetical protein [Methylovulum psychrotolerans]